MPGGHYVITIGRQLGSGGALMGKQLADHFGFQYIDKELLLKASEELNIPAGSLEELDEKEPFNWSTLIQTAVYEMPYVADEWYVPTGRQLFEEQSKLIKEAVERSSCVVVGRCASHLFRNYDRHVSLFLYAELEKRMERLKGIIDLSERKAQKFIDKADKDRAKYFNTFTGKKWLDLRQYDFSINSGMLDDMTLKSHLIDCVCTKYPELKK